MCVTEKSLNSYQSNFLDQMDTNNKYSSEKAGSSNFHGLSDELSADHYALIDEIKEKRPEVCALETEMKDAVFHLQQLSVAENAPENETEYKKYLEQFELASKAQVALISPLLVKCERIEKAEYAKVMLVPDISLSDLMSIVTMKGSKLLTYPSTDAMLLPPLVGALPILESVPLEEGDSVAAFHKYNWILADVVRKLKLNLYELHDLDDRKAPTSTFTVARKFMVPLPKFKANPSHHPEALFPVNAIVQALYPGTTVFYKAAVTKVPRSSDDPYEVAFYDDTCASGFADPLPVAQRYVVTFKDVNSGNKKHNKGKKK